MNITKLKPEDTPKFIPKKDRKSWPFKGMKIGEAIQIPDGYNGKTLSEISGVAHAHAHGSDRKVRVKIDRLIGNGVVTVLREA